MIDYGKPFDRKDFLKNVSYYIEHHWGSYKELIELTMKDFIEIRVGIESKMQEEQLEKAMSDGGSTMG